MRRGSSQSGVSLVSLGGHGLSTPLFSAGQVGSARKGSGFFACSTPGGVGGQDGLRRIGRPSSATRPAGKCRTVATSDAGSSDPRPLPGAPFRLVGGTRVFACVRPFLSCGRRRHSARVRPPEVSSVGPHPVHDHGEPACEGDLRRLSRCLSSRSAWPRIGAMTIGHDAAERSLPDTRLCGPSRHRND